MSFLTDLLKVGAGAVFAATLVALQNVDDEDCETSFDVVNAKIGKLNDNMQERAEKLRVEVRKKEANSEREGRIRYAKMNDEQLQSEIERLKQSPSSAVKRGRVAAMKSEIEKRNSRE